MQYRPTIACAKMQCCPPNHFFLGGGDMAYKLFQLSQASLYEHSMVFIFIQSVSLMCVIVCVLTM